MQSDFLLQVAMWICFALAVIWVVLSVYARWQRRTYNLTRAESGGAAATPDFLKVDHEKRRAALERGAPSAASATPAPTTSRFAQLAGYGATVFAVLALIVAALKALTSLDEYTAMANEAASLVTDTDAMASVFRDYWPGIIIALAVILVQVGRVIATLKKE